MKLSLISLATLGTLLAFAACADSENAATPNDPDASGLPNVDAEPPPDAGAQPDAAPRECSVHGFCPTVVPGAQTIYGVWGDGSSVWAATEEGNVLQFDPSSGSSASWKVHTTGLGPLYAIWGSGPSDVWVGGASGLYHGTGSPLVFAPVASTSGTPVWIWSIHGNAAGDVWAAGNTVEDVPQGQILHWTTGATAAIDPVSTNGTAPAFYRVWGSPASGIWISGVRPQVIEPAFEEVVLLQRRPGQTTFTEVPLPDDPGESYPPYAKSARVLASAVTGNTMFLFTRGPGNSPGLIRGSSTDGLAFTLTYARWQNFTDPDIRSLSLRADNDAWAVGEYGMARHWDGTSWSTTAITRSKFPIIDPLYAVWAGSPDDVWFGGKDLALKRDPTKVQP